MDTRHRIIVSDARELDDIADDSVELVVTSPPYPMIEMWDELFVELDPEVGTALEAGQGRDAFERMHHILDTVWAEIERVLVPGGIACINIGDATRRLDGEFRRYANHARVTRGFEECGFAPLPVIHWHKPTNAATKFMGSGMVPPNAYVTQEHEQILIFRNGGTLRDFPPGAPRRYEAAYFWEERNRWFADRWSDVGSRRQEIDGAGRDRAGAFPIDVPYRLIAMYSVYEDTVLDPFWGTGTTTLAAMAAGRNSVGVELDESFDERFRQRVERAPSITADIVQERLDQHEAFVQEMQSTGDDLPHRMESLDLPVKTGQETELQLYEIAEIEEQEMAYRVTHRPIRVDQA